MVGITVTIILNLTTEVMVICPDLDGGRNRLKQDTRSKVKEYISFYDNIVSVC